MFPRTTVAVVFVLTYQSIANELYAAHDKSVDATAVFEAYQRVCKGILTEIKAAGFSSLSLSAADKVNLNSNPLVSPPKLECWFCVFWKVTELFVFFLVQDIATSLGLTASEQDYGVMYPTPLFTKPILCIQDFNETIRQYATKVTQSGSPLIVYPSFTDSDIMRPFLLSKLYLQVFSGCAWSKSGPTFLEGAVDVRCVKLRLAFSSQLFFKPAPYASSCADKLPPGYRDALLGVLSGDCARVILLPSNDAVMQSSANDSASNLTIEDLAKAEKLLWALLTTQDDSTACVVPTKAEAMMCLKLYRTVLSTANWKASDKGYLAGRALAVNDLFGECEEYFSLLSLMGVLSRTVLLGAAASSSLTGTRVNLPINPATLSIDNDLPGTNFQKRAAVCDLIDVSQPYVPKVFPKNAQITSILTNIVQNNILFRNYQADQHAAIVEGFEHIDVALGEVLIKQGDPGEYFYIIESGEVDIHMESAGFKIKVGRTLTTGDYFGELALMYNTPRAATVVCTVPGVLWRMSRQTYRTIVTQHSKNTAKEFIELISNVQILGKRLGDVFSVNELNKVVSSLEVEAFEDGACIVRQYLTGDYFYIITEGQVDVYQDKSNRASIPDATAAYQDPFNNNAVSRMELKDLYGKKVATLSRGNYFGEKALLADDVRQASCIAVGKVVCLSLSREDFIAMLGTWHDISESGTSEETATFQDVTTARPNFQLSVKLEDLDTISVLGVGAFGRVKHVRHKPSGQEYALKAQAKAFITSQGMQKMLINEMNIMRTVNHACIAKIHSAMQDSKFVYFLLELLPGGEFFNFLQSAGKLSEEKCRFYSAAVVLALGELHRNKIAYRDLKPENMVSEGAFILFGSFCASLIDSCCCCRTLFLG